jgi:hypothetical protein
VAVKIAPRVCANVLAVCQTPNSPRMCGGADMHGVSSGARCTASCGAIIPRHLVLIRPSSTRYECRSACYHRESQCFSPRVLRRRLCQRTVYRDPELRGCLFQPNQNATACYRPLAWCRYGGCSCSPCQTEQDGWIHIFECCKRGPKEIYW